MRCRRRNREVNFIWIQSAVAAAAPCVVTCTAVVPAAAVLLLPAAVRHRVLPDDKFCCWFVESDPSVFFLFIQTRFLFDVPLGSTVAFTASICLHSR